LFPYDTSLTGGLLCAELKLNPKKHLKEVIKYRDACLAKTLEIGKDWDI
jgi:hypothetical protein